ncbi:MAG: hypothetical protein A2081_01550 [Elusimicrobia bacterium GWC2_61_19]|nr:MAG: hypothetical protein A2081_01550 [Elusimicrobia bacterium GWC2_61_19]
MGSKFVEKHKRKSVLAALLFIFQGRTKYIGIMLIVTILSVPFVISGETLGSIIELRPVAAFLRSIGMGSVVSAINPKYSNDLLKAALDKAVDDSENNSFWNKFLKSINATMPPAGSPSSMTLLRGGKDIYGLPEIKEPKGAKPGPGQIKGAVNAEERERGETGDEVDLESLLASGTGGEGGGLYGDVMGQNLAGRFEGGAAADNAPYINRTAFGGSAVAARSSGMYNNVMGQAGSKVPVPGAAQKVNTNRKMGRVSGFTWKNVGYKTKSNNLNMKIGDKKPMFQLAQTFAMTSSAYKSKESAYEYQHAYTGATYDGNNVNADVIDTGDAGVVMPDVGFMGGLIDATVGVQQAAMDCAKAQGDQGAKMSDAGKKLADIAKTLGKKPKCCNHGAVDSWNDKQRRLVEQCAIFNANEAILSKKCQTISSPMSCSIYSNEMVSKCSKWKCWLAILFMIFLFVSGGIIGVMIAAMLAGVVSFDFKNLGGKVDAMISWVASGGDDSQKGEGE